MQPLFIIRYSLNSENAMFTASELLEKINEVGLDLFADLAVPLSGRRTNHDLDPHGGHALRKSKKPVLEMGR